MTLLFLCPLTTLVIVLFSFNNFVVWPPRIRLHFHKYTTDTPSKLLQRPWKEPWSMRFLQFYSPFNSVSSHMLTHKHSMWSKISLGQHSSTSGISLEILTIWRPVRTLYLVPHCWNYPVLIATTLARAGDVIWLNRSDALSQQLAFVNDNGHAIIKVDNTTNVLFNDKRNTVRAFSLDFF